MKKSCLQLILLVAFLLVATDLQPVASGILPSDQTMPPVPPFVPLDRFPCIKWYPTIPPCRTTGECAGLCNCPFCVNGKCCCKC
ncbi:hypothetical protein AQUCO_00200974v1 [Aquilegia coerulea]|uniref:Uncharacterized protein n=1 Tax=Aquilegia coerulea TaxID=218851 RepID=A0A2G5F5U7_AQUCA|nr:hypothetical protein AQUCO_00200974v1 [Aquilegia coerulea]